MGNKQSLLIRHPEAAAQRPSKGDGPGRPSFEARSLRSLAPQDDGAMEDTR